MPTEKLDANPVVEQSPTKETKTRHQPARHISLQQLFHSLQEQMTAKMQTSRAFISHHSTMGSTHEQAWLALLNAYLPGRYRADSAFVVDSTGDLSEQIDIVLYDRQYSPLLFHQDGALYIPAESVYAVFDVKTEWRRESFLESAAKTASVRRLRRTTVPIPHAGGTFQPKPPFEILGGILGLECSWPFGPLPSSLDQTLAQLPPDRLLQLGCAVHSGAFVASRHNSELTIQKSLRDSALIFFFLRLLHHLQLLGTVPAMDLMEYGREAM